MKISPVMRKFLSVKPVFDRAERVDRATQRNYLKGLRDPFCAAETGLSPQLLDLVGSFPWPIDVEKVPFCVGGTFLDFLDEEAVKRSYHGRGELHYAVDLHVKAGTEILAIESGEIAYFYDDRGRESVANLYLASKDSRILWSLLHLDEASLRKRFSGLGTSDDWLFGVNPLPRIPIEAEKPVSLVAEYDYFYPIEGFPDEFSDGYHLHLSAHDIIDGTRILRDDKFRRALIRQFPLNPLFLLRPLFPVEEI